MKRLTASLHLWLAALALVLAPGRPAFAEKQESLIQNSNMEVDSDGDGWPDGWPKLKEGASWEVEEGNRYIRLQCTAPDTVVSLFRSIPIPGDAKALKLTYRWRVSKLVPGKMPWFDARIIMEVRDQSGVPLKPQPPAPYSRTNNKNGWVRKEVSFLVPEGGTKLDLMPSLFKVKQGILDLDDIVIQPVDPAPLIAEREARAAQIAKAFVPREEPNKERWPAELRVVGNQVQTVDGKTVWLQGLNIPSMEWNADGEQVQKSTIVAIEQWKANVIRLPVNEDFWFGRREQTDGGKRYRDLVDQVDILGLIQQHKLHWTGWCFHPRATPRMLLDWDYTPTPFWGQQGKDALSCKQFPPPARLR